MWASRASSVRSFRCWGEELLGRVAPLRGDAEQGREQRRHSGDIPARLGQQSLELGETRPGLVLAAEAGSALELGDERVEGGARMLR